jgi:HEAT repeat protein
MIVRVCAALLILFAVGAAVQAQDELEKDEVKELLKEFKSDYRDKDPNMRSMAIENLVGQLHADVLKELAKVASKDPDPAVRIAAIEAMKEYDAENKTLIKSLPKVLGAAKNLPEVEAAALKAMGEVGNPAYGKMVAAYFKHKNRDVIRAAIVASGNIKDKSLLEQLINLLGNMEGSQNNLSEEIRKINDDLSRQNYRGGRGGAPTSGGGGGSGLFGGGGSSGSSGGGGGGGDEEDTRPTRRELEDRLERAQEGADRAGELIPAVNEALSSMTGTSQGGAQGWGQWWKTEGRRFQFPE